MSKSRAPRPTSGHQKGRNFQGLETEAQRHLVDSIWLHSCGNPFQALYHAQEAVRYEQQNEANSKNSDKKLTFSCAFHLATMYHANAMYEEGAKAYTNLLQNARSWNHSVEKSINYALRSKLQVNLGNVYLEQNLHLQAINMYVGAFNGLKTGAEDVVRSKALHNMGVAYIFMKDVEKAKVVLDGALQRLHGDREGLFPDTMHILNALKMEQSIDPSRLKTTLYWFDLTCLHAVYRHSCISDELLQAIQANPQFGSSSLHPIFPSRFNQALSPSPAQSPRPPSAIKTPNVLKNRHRPASGKSYRPNSGQPNRVSSSAGLSGTTSPRSAVPPSPAHLQTPQSTSKRPYQQSSEYGGPIHSVVEPRDNGLSNMTPTMTPSRTPGRAPGRATSPNANQSSHVKVCRWLAGGHRQLDAMEMVDEYSDDDGTPNLDADLGPEMDVTCDDIFGRGAHSNPSRELDTYTYARPRTAGERSHPMPSRATTPGAALVEGVPYSEPGHRIPVRNRPPSSSRREGQSQRQSRMTKRVSIYQDELDTPYHHVMGLDRDSSDGDEYMVQRLGDEFGDTPYRHTHTHTHTFSHQSRNQSRNGNLNTSYHPPQPDVLRERSMVASSHREFESYSLSSTHAYQHLPATTPPRAPRPPSRQPLSEYTSSTITSSTHPHTSSTITSSTHPHTPSTITPSTHPHTSSTITPSTHPQPDTLPNVASDPSNSKEYISARSSLNRAKYDYEQLILILDDDHEEVITARATLDHWTRVVQSLEPPKERPATRLGLPLPQATSNATHPESSTYASSNVTTCKLGLRPQNCSPRFGLKEARTPGPGFVSGLDLKGIAKKDGGKVPPQWLQETGLLCPDDPSSKFCVVSKHSGIPHIARMKTSPELPCPVDEAIALHSGLIVVWDVAKKQKSLLRVVARSHENELREEIRLGMQLHHPCLMKPTRIFLHAEMLYLEYPHVGGRGTIAWSMEALQKHRQIQDSPRATTPNPFPINSGKAEEMGPLKPWQVQDLFRSALHMLSYCHSQGLWISNFSPYTVLVDQQCQPHFFAVGFPLLGLDRMEVGIHNVVHYSLTRYLAPESVGQPQEGSGPRDMFALGCSLYALHFGERDFRALASACHVAYMPQGMSETNPQLIDLVQRLLAANPVERLSANEALVHPYFSSQSYMEVLNSRNHRLLYASEEKITHFNAYLDQLTRDRPHIPIAINRQTFINDVVEVFATIQPDMLHCPFQVSFIGETAIDFGGVTHEMFAEFSERIFRNFPNNSRFFQTADQGPDHTNAEGGDSFDHGTFIPNPENDNILVYEIIGKIFLKCLIDRRSLHLRFAPIVFRYLLMDTPYSPGTSHMPSEVWEWLQEMESYDATIAKNMKQLLLMGDCRDCCLVTRSGVPVTNANREAYVLEEIEWKLLGSVQPQLEAMRRGFQCLPSLRHSPFSSFTHKELVLCLCGKDVIDAEMVIKNLEFRSWDRTDSTPHYLCTVLRAMSSAQLRNFLRLCTSLSTIPFGGLSRKIGVFKSHRFYSHTCFSQLEMPNYDSLNDLRTALHTALASLDLCSEMQEDGDDVIDVPVPDTWTQTMGQGAGDS